MQKQISDQTVIKNDTFINYNEHWFVQYSSTVQTVGVNPIYRLLLL